ncbi:MAG: hypothetical protein Q4G40_12310 [Brachybacterium sp.]|nr:hypothetical protein [Brachybacterium sp.]
MPGKADERRVDEVLAAGAAFHDALADLPRPAFLDAAEDPWSVADRVAWGEAPPPTGDLVESLLAECGEPTEPCQIIHGDLLGNVLFADGHPPTIIDWAPYWRPAGYSAAVAVVDAVCWHRVPLAALLVDRGYASWRELLLRALVFRTATLQLLEAWDHDMNARHGPVAEAILRLD